MAEKKTGKLTKGSHAPQSGDGETWLATLKVERSARNGQKSHADEKCSYKCGQPGTKKNYPDCSHVLCNKCFTPSCEYGCPLCKLIADESKKKMNKTTEEKTSKVGNSTQSEETENCPICMDVLSKPKRLSCGHNFHADCIKQSLKYKPACPICGTVMGQLIGNQPEGTMSDNVRDYSLPGYEDCKTIEIFYDFPDGLQKDIHPNPGKPYTGTRRKAFLPNNPEGKKVLELLKVAFDRKLIFTIGESRTTGKRDTVTWNDIHHKTRKNGGPTNFGYPDKTYLSRVQEELAAKGVTKKGIEDNTDCTIS